MNPEPFSPGHGWPLGPRRLVLLGPPGTGKTHAALGSWILPALRDGVPPESILSCSFTRAAAGNLRERLSRESGIPERELRWTCSTIHAEANRLISSSGAKFSIFGSKSRKRDDSDEVDRVQEPAERVPTEDPDSAVMACWDYARATLADDVSSAAFMSAAREKAGKIPLQRLKLEIARYESAKKNTASIDFTDMLIRAKDLPAPARRLLIVDEAQDTSLLQWSLLEGWFREAETVVLVGDFDQTIHEWCGASPTRFRALLAEGWSLASLTRSYRVPRAVHAVAVDLIRQNRDRIDAAYEPKGDDGEVWLADHREARSRLRDFHEEHAAANEGRQEKDRRRAFVLARSARILTRWAKELEEACVPFLNERGGSPLGAPSQLAVARAVLDLRAAGKCGTEDARALVKALPAQGEFRGVYFQPGKKGSAAKALHDHGWDEATLDLLASYGVEVGAITGRGQGRVTGHDAELELLLRCGLEGRAASLLALVAAHGRSVLDRTPVISLTTMHASKGREADLVVVVCECPSPVAEAVSLRPSRLESERRLLYVALTRCERELVLTGTGDLDGLLGLRASAATPRPRPGPRSTPELGPPGPVTHPETDLRSEEESEWRLGLYDR